MEPVRSQEMILLVVSVGLLLRANFVASAEPATPSTNSFDLRTSCSDWQAGFADYPPGEETFYELASMCQTAGTNLNRGFFIAGNNHSDDLFMFIKHQIHGLKAATSYKVDGRVQFLSRAPRDCGGVGGSPGESVFVKFGASQQEPLSIVKDGMRRMNVDIGHQSNSGTNAVVIGNIATTLTDCNNQAFESKEESTKSPVTVCSDAQGQLWIFVGTDSGFEGKSALIYTKVSIEMR